MTQYIEALKSCICNNELSSETFSDMLSGLNKQLTEELDQMIRTQAGQYRSFLGSSGNETGTDVDPSRLEEIVAVFPSSLLTIATGWNVNPSALDASKKLILAITAYLLSRNREDEQHIDALLNGIDTSEGLKQLNARLLQKSGDHAYLPKRVFTDFLAIANNRIQFQVTTNIDALLENLFCFEGLSQFFLGYYLRSLQQAQTDFVAGHIHLLFQSLFSSLKQSETAYWKNYKNYKELLNHLFSLTDREIDKHGKINLHRFLAEKVLIYIPMVSNQADQLQSELESRLKPVLDLLFNLSLTGLLLFFQTVYAYKGATYILYLFEAFGELQPKKMTTFHGFLENQKSKINKDLHILIDHIMEKKSVPEKVREDSSAAQTDQQTGFALSRDEIDRYLRELLLQQYENARAQSTSGRANIKQYLALLSKTAAETLSSVSIDREGVELFALLLKPIIETLSNRKTLTFKEIDVLSHEVDIQAEQHLVNLQEIKELLEPESGNAPAGLVSEVGPSDLMADPLLSQQIVPIGFEKDAPRISLADFFRFPLGKTESGDSADHRFADHFRYLSMAADRSLIDRNILPQIKDSASRLPNIDYKKRFDIFPLNQFDETALLVVFSLWQNKVLDNLVA